MILFNLFVQFVACLKAFAQLLLRCLAEINHLHPVQQLIIYLMVAAAISFLFSQYYGKMKNAYLKDDKFPERGCRLFYLTLALIACVLGLTLCVNFWVIFWLLIGAAICTILIWNELSWEIPRIERIEKAKENHEILFFPCGKKLYPPHYDKYR